MDWQQGESVEHLYQKHYDFKQYSTARKIKWLSSCVQDLETLHISGRLFGDMKLGNSILNLANDTLKLIDFGAVQKVDSAKDFFYTPAFTDQSEGEPKKLASDMFAIGYLISILFPELFIDDVGIYRMPIFGQIRVEHISEKRTDVTFTNSDQAILSLHEALMEKNQENRCTNQQVILFCTKMLEMLANKKEISSNELHSLLSTTINRGQFEVEDALRGSKRPAKFGAVMQNREAASEPTGSLFAQTMKVKTESGDHVEGVMEPIHKM